MSQLLDDVFGAPVATGTVATVLGQAADLVAPAAAEVTRLLADAKVVCLDETGARAAGRLHWLHSASTSWLSLYTVHARRGRPAMDDAGVLPDFAGVAVRDGWKPLRGYARSAMVCATHHIREFWSSKANSGPRT